MVDDWFTGFVAEHWVRHATAGLPDQRTEAGMEAVDALRSNFIHRGVSDYDVATEASKLVFGETLRHSSQHFPRLIELAVGIYRSRQPQGGGSGVTADRDAAVAQSKDCPRCGGGGMAPVYHPDPKFARYAFSGHCVCPMGRWMRSKVADADRARIVDLAAPGRWLLEPPGLDPGGAIGDALRHFTASELMHDWAGRARDARPGPRPRVVAGMVTPSDEHARDMAERKAELNRQFPLRRPGGEVA